MLGVAPAPWHGAHAAAGNMGPGDWLVLGLMFGIFIGFVLGALLGPGPSPGGGWWFRRPGPSRPKGPNPPKPGPIPDFIPDEWIAQHASTAWRKVRDTFGVHV